MNGHRYNGRQGGFNLMEALVVLAIISILSVVAIPSYLHYKVRAQVSTGMSLGAEARTRIVEYYLSNGSWPQDNAEAGLKNPQDYRTEHVQSIQVSNVANTPRLTITYDIPRLGNRNTLAYVPTTAGHRVRWRCDEGSLLNKYRPPSCKK